MAVENIKNKNPFAVCWGLLLRKIRENRSWQYADIERMSGISQDFYRNIERANFNLHVSQSIPLYETFKNEVIGETFKLDAIIQVLSVISIMEAKANEDKRAGDDKKVSYYTGLKYTAIELADGSKKLSKLFSKFFDLNLFSHEITQSDLIVTIEKEELLFEMENFLTKYSTYGEEGENKVKMEYVNNFFDNVPSIYTDFFSETKRNLLGIPIKMIFSELQKWEKSNENKFEELYVLNTGNFDPTTLNNLEEYHYTYLFKENFKRARFLVVDTIRTSNQVKSAFDTNLLKAYEKCKLKKPKNWEEGLNKIQFEVLPKLTDELISILTVNEIAGKNKQVCYECFWVFRFTNEILIGFVANTVKLKESNRYVFDEGKNLFISDLALRFSMIKKFF